MTALRQSLHTFLESQSFGVVSTIGSTGSPESAFVAYSESDDFSIVFGTFVDSRKYRNIARDPRVSFVVSGDDRTVQIEGTARELTGEEEERCRHRHVVKNPKAKKYAYDERERFVVITPTWIRFTDYTTDPDTVEELRF